MKSYRLSSTPLCYTPGVVRYARHVGKEDKEMGRHLITEAFPSLSIEAVNQLLAGEYLVDEKSETILLEVEE